MPFMMTRLFFAVGVAFVVTSCASPSRLGMVQQEGTGLQFGSEVSKNFVTDSSFYPNKKIKIRTRNTSGDTAFDLRRFTNDLRDAYRAKGYVPTNDDDFGLLIDINVKYSGQIQRNLATEYGTLGAAGGGLIGASSRRGGAVETLGGIVAGATLGAIIGSYVTEDTYIIIASVTFGEVRDVVKSKKTVTFSRSLKNRHEAEDENIESRRSRGFKRTWHNRVSVYAGGLNTPQSRIASEVRQRIILIVSDII